MFTFNVYLKFAAIALCLGGGVVLSIIMGFWYSFPFILVGLLLLLSYLLLGTVQSAAQIMEKQDFDATERRLNLTFFPKLLYKTNRSYYFLIKGSLALNSKDFESAEELFQTAQQVGLPSDNEKALVGMQLANIAVNKNNWNGAKLHFNKVKKLKVNDPNLKQQIKDFEKSFKNRGVLKHHGLKGQRGAMQPGGKRRRPKMR